MFRAKLHFRLMCAAAFVSLLGACASAPPMGAQHMDDALILDGTPFMRAGLLPARLEPVELLAVNDDMRAFLAEHVNLRASDRSKVKQIVFKHLYSELFQGGNLSLYYGIFYTIS